MRTSRSTRTLNDCYEACPPETCPQPRGKARTPGGPRPRRRAGLVEQATEWRRIDSAGNPPGVMEQGRNYIQWDVLSGKVAMRLPRQQHALKLAVWSALAGKLNAGNLVVAFQKCRLRRLGQVAFEKAYRRLGAVKVLGREMETCVRQPIL